MAFKRTLFPLLGAASALFAVFGAGYYVANGQLQANIDFVDRKNDELEQKLEQAENEVTDLKLQLSRVLFPDEQINQPPSPNLSNSGVEAVTAAHGEGPQKITIAEDDSAILFDGELVISVVALRIERLSSQSKFAP